jgi:precorrin-6B methylase 2
MMDWVQLWRELAEVHMQMGRKTKAEQAEDAWRDKARSFDQNTKRRWAKPDSSRDFLLSRVEACPGSTVLDIGAGTGAWTVLLARHVRHVTAVEPSLAMIEVLRENLAAEGLSNVDIVQGHWPEVRVEPHDFSLCAHAMYGCADLPGFVQAMQAATRRTCCLVLRAPLTDSLMARASMHVWGHPYDSTNFQVAYNVLLQIGLFPNVLMENTGLWDPWVNASLEEALGDIKRRFGLQDSHEHDVFLLDLLHRELISQDGQYVWPRGVRSALAYWDI